MPGITTEVEVTRRPLSDYADAAGADAVERIRALAEPLAGVRVLHIAPSAGGSHAAGHLGALLPLLRDAGVEVHWRVVSGGGPAARVARALEDGLRGAETAISGDDWSAYRDAWSGAGAGGFDLVVAHDAGALGLGASPPENCVLVWRAGIDAARPDPPAWERARPLAERFDAAVFPLASFAPPGLEGVREIRPAIDPLGPRCRDLPLKLAGESLRMLGLDLERPLCCQVGALDPWRDPHDTIDAFRLAKEEEPSLQLVLAGAPAAGDDEGWRVAGEVAAYAAGTPDLHVLTGYAGVGETELNALQRLSRAALARSVREDFAISASEALWKGTPVVAAPDGGLPEQVADGVTGLIAHTAEDTARALVELVRDPALSIVLGAAGRERVRERFLVTRLVADELELMASLLRATVRRP